jgi:hypothetical protein
MSSLEGTSTHITSSLIPRAVGPAVETLERAWAEFGEHYWMPASRQALDLHARFDGLVQRWNRDTQLTSSMTEIIAHPAYLEVVAMGGSVVPLLLREMEKGGRLWAPALRAITGVQPVPRESAGNAKRTVEAWLKWGRAHGYEWK